MRICTKEGCNEKYRSNSFCKKHFNEWYRNTEKGKLAQINFRLSDKYKTNDPKYIEKRRINTAKWYTTEKGKAYSRISQRTNYKYKNVKLMCLVFNCKNKDIHKHHEDYGKPYAIIPLCALHHRELHGGKLNVVQIEK